MGRVVAVLAVLQAVAGIVHAIVSLVYGDFVLGLASHLLVGGLYVTLGLQVRGPATSL